MKVKIELVMDGKQAAFIAHRLTMCAFDAQKDAAFWEVMGDKEHGVRCRTNQQLLASVGHAFATAHWTIGQTEQFEKDEALSNVSV